MPWSSGVVTARFVGGPYHGQQMRIQAGSPAIRVPVHTQVPPQLERGGELRMEPPKFLTYRPRSIEGVTEVWVLDDIATSVAVDLLIDLAFRRPKKEH